VLATPQMAASEDGGAMKKIPKYKDLANLLIIFVTLIEKLFNLQHDFFK
jgi:hypothetical protein